MSDQQNPDWTKQVYVADMANNLILVVANAQKKCYTMLQLDRNTVTDALSGWQRCGKGAIAPVLRIFLWTRYEECL